MKKLTMGLMLSLISIVTVNTANACTIEAKGYCGDQSSFLVVNANPNSTHYLVDDLTKDTLLTFATGSVVHDSIIKLTMLPGVKVFLRYRYTNRETFDAWIPSAISADYQWENCGTLAIAITDVVATLKDGNLKVSFTSLDENQVMKYQIVGSTDGKEYNTLLKAIDPTGAGNYSTTIPMPYAAAGIGALLFLAVGVRNRKLFALMSVIAITFIFVSCSKEKKIEPDADLTKITSIRVVAVQTTGAQVFSDVKPIK